ncbi:hypothetical protein GCM10028828_20650 [Corynebacterium tapiri]
MWLALVVPIVSLLLLPWVIQQVAPGPGPDVKAVRFQEVSTQPVEVPGLTCEFNGDVTSSWGYRCDGVEVDSSIADATDDPDKALRRMADGLNSIVDYGDTGEVIRSGDSRLLMDEGSSTIALAVPHPDGTLYISTYPDDSGAPHLGEKQKELVSEIWRAATQDELPKELAE